MSTQSFKWKTWINYIFFSNEKLSEFIKNDSNNENWPTINYFVNQLRQANFGIEKQREIIEKVFKWKQRKDEKGKGKEEDEPSDTEKRIYEALEIVLTKRDKNSITFFWSLPRNFKGETYLSEIDNYLLNYLGEWYEVKNWELKSPLSNQVEITAVKSIFYNYYYHLAKSGVNGILHHSNYVRGEICSCPNFDKADFFYKFTTIYEQNLNLFRLIKENFGKTVLVSPDDKLPVFYPSLVTRAPLEKELSVSAEFKDYFSIASQEDFYMLLNDRGSKEEDIKRIFSKDISTFPVHREQIIFTELGKWNEKAGKYEVERKNGLFLKLEEMGLTKPEMDHFLMNHITGNLYWRGRRIWRGNAYPIIYSGLVINESINPSGNCYTLETAGSVLTQVNENITMDFSKGENLGGHLKITASVIASVYGVNLSLNNSSQKNSTSGSETSKREERNTERQIISQNGVEKTIERESKVTKTSKGRGNKTNPNPLKLGNQFLQPFLNYSTDTFSFETSFYQFLHKWEYGGNRPLTFEIEIQTDLLNQFRNRRELKGKMGYDYFNSKYLGKYLNAPGYFKASIISWNYNMPYEEWFREKIEDGVYLYSEKGHWEFYQKNLTPPEQFKSKGFINFVRPNNTEEIKPITEAPFPRNFIREGVIYKFDKKTEDPNKLVEDFLKKDDNEEE